ncbi:Acyl-CoA oxidase C-terminal [Arabidopsis thaliana x Arabidopsis arenosa]|uniref:Acyl-coenzyme A oxidase n=1 Tax=Arabidopsis thaliana x Arabidopsis arenosa TaxID=1240361 RepID=A0A8T2GE52_9BRAS|nr:Acyl-CoA oxidase C-terminal [Arabidopsis thaliana x Arabidopsis arenosa]
MSDNRALRRAHVLANHILQSNPPSSNPSLSRELCLQYSPPELNESYGFDVKEMRKLLDGHNVVDRDWIYGLMMQSNLFNRKERGGKIFVSPDYNQTMEQQREITMKRIWYLLENGVFKGWLTETGPEAELRKLALLEVCGIYDHSVSIKVGVHFFLWGNAVKFFGTKRHHEKWLKNTEDYVVKGCFAMTELGHGSNVRGIETVTTYDPKTEEFVINTPCESAQKYWIGGAANHATHTIVFSQLHINGTNQGVHAFIAQIRDQDGSICPNIRIADCGHKIGLNGVDNGRIWFDNLRIPRENLLNAVADVSSDGKYVSSIKDPDQRFGAFMAPLTSGRVTIASSAIYSAKVGLSIAIRYSLSRRAFSVTANGPEVLLLDYPSHQRRLLPLLAKTYAMSFAANELKMIYVKRTPETNKAIHVVSSGFKAVLTWHNMHTLQECREAVGGQGVKTENLVGQLKGEFDVQTTFEGDNNVLMQQVSKALFAEYVSCKKRNKPFKGLGLEHMNSPRPVLPTQLTSSTLRCSQFQKSVFCLRERDLLERFTSEVAELQGRGESREFLFLLNHQLSEDLSKAFTEKAILQTVLDAEAKLPPGSVKDVLGLVRSMYALISLEEDPSLLRYGHLSRDNVGDVRKEVSKLCGELRPHALALVASFGIPDAFLSPIAFNWVEANAWSSL